MIAASLPEVRERYTACEIANFSKNVNIGVLHGFYGRSSAAHLEALKL